MDSVENIEKLYSKKNLKKLWILLLMVCVIIIITFFYVIFYNHMKMQAVVGALYNYDKQAAESLTYILFRGEIERNTIQLGNQVIKEMGYTENGFQYIKNLGFGDKNIRIVMIFVLFFLCALMFFVIKWIQNYINIHNSIVKQNIDLKKTLEAYQESSKRRQKQLQDFVENIAHQIKTPMAAISLNLDVIKVDQKYDDDCIKDCFIHINRVKEFVKRLLYISRMESGKVIMTSQKVILSDILTQAVDLSGIEKEKVIINIEGIMKEYSLYVDEQWIGEAIINILVNSYEFIKEKSDGRIYISVIQQEDKCILLICDNGDGIEAESLENIFDRFRTTNTVSSLHVGIGLNLAKLIIEAHHGSIYASNSEEYGGAQFRITIPRHFMLSEKTTIKKEG